MSEQIEIGTQSTATSSKKSTIIKNVFLNAVLMLFDTPDSKRTNAKENNSKKHNHHMPIVYAHY